jgi:hypothetical protein
VWAAVPSMPIVMGHSKRLRSAKLWANFHAGLKNDEVSD